MNTSTFLTLDDIQQLAQWALDEHGLADRGWTFAWDRAVRRAGCCRFGPRRITLSRPIFHIAGNREDALDTILHEVAHALAGPRAGHGPIWRRVAQQIGARPERCHLLEVPTMFVGVCACGPVHARHRDPGAARSWCRRCSELVEWQNRNKRSSTA